jgi:hypothetical protein
MAILKEEQKLLEIQSTVIETIYVFEKETLRVRYLHGLLEVGKIYPRNFIIGDGVKVYQKTDRNNAWWRQIDWRGGISLDPLIPFKGLYLVDRDVSAYAAGSDTGSVAGSKLHARMRLTEDYQKENAYWEEVARKETAANVYLNTFIQLPEEVDSGQATIPDTFAKLLALNAEANEINKTLGKPAEVPDVRALPTSKLVNPIDVFFQAVLGERGFILEIDTAKLPNVAAAFEFLARERPIGCTPIIISHAPNLPIESALFGSNIVARHNVLIQDTVPASVVQTVNLNTLVKEYVTITHESPA